MALVNWDNSNEKSFIQMQFDAQDHFFRSAYPGAYYQVIFMDEQPVGRLYTHERENEIRLMDISILPEFRNQGIGSLLVKRIIEKARKQDLPVTLYVERHNPAQRFYERLGFRFMEDKGMYVYMKWSPASFRGKE